MSARALRRARPAHHRGLDVVNIAATQITINSGCAPTIVRIRGTKKGTTVRATFKPNTCRNIKGKAKLTGLIDLTCKQLTGTFVAKKSKVKRPFVATISTCGDQFWDPIGEECDAGQGCTQTEQCSAACACEPLIPTTTTSVPHGTTTSTTAPKPDLTPTDFQGPAAGDAGAQITLSWTVKNQGQLQATAPWNDAVFLSEDDVYSGSDRPLGGAFQHQTGLPVGQTYDKTDAVVTLPDLAAGSYFLIVRTDSSSQVAETNESNNTKAIPITLRTPDLVPTDFTGPTTGVASTAITVSWTVANQGTGSCPPSWNDTIYFSEDAVLGTGDRTLNTFAHNVALDVSQSYDKTNQSVTLPAVAAGDYFLIVKTDNSNQQFEENENNNTRAIPITIQTADLTPTAFTGPSTASAGKPLMVSWTIANQGSGTANPPWNDTVYFSQDDVLGTGDTSLGTFARNVALGVGQTYDKVDQPVTIPAVAVGNYFLIVKTDNSGTVFEPNENNNTRAIAITVQTPDLTPTDLGAPASAGAGAQITVSWTVANQGTGPATPAWNDTVYLSEDDVPGSGDRTLGSFQHTVALNAGDSYAKTDAVVTIPNIPAGNYFIVLKTDNSSTVFESNENNNTRAIAFTVQTPDLVPTALSAPGSAAKGAQISISWTVANQGTGVANPSWSDAIYLSLDETIGTGDVNLGSVARNVALNPNQSYDKTNVNVTIPTTTAPGSYFLIVRTDNGSQIFEASDTNNTKTFAISVTP